MLSKIIGQDHAVSLLRSHISSGRVPPAMLFSGPEGVGRMLAARAFAFALSCVRKSGCGSCEACRANTLGEGVRIVDIAEILADDAEKIKTNALRRILVSHTRAHLLPWLVVIMDHADLMNDTMQAVMLRTAEEPPSGVCYIMLTSSLARFNSALRSRSEIIRFRRLSVADLTLILPETSSLGPLIACADGSVSAAAELSSRFKNENDFLDKIFLRGELRGKKRADIIKDLAWAIPAAAKIRPAWKRSLVELDSAVRANAHMQLAFNVFRSRVATSQ